MLEADGGFEFPLHPIPPPPASGKTKCIKAMPEHSYMTWANNQARSCSKASGAVESSNQIIGVADAVPMNDYD